MIYCITARKEDITTAVKIKLKEGFKTIGKPMPIDKTYSVQRMITKEKNER